MKKTSGFNRLKGLAGAGTLAAASLLGGVQGAHASPTRATIRITNTVSSASIGAITTKDSYAVGFRLKSFTSLNASTVPSPYAAYISVSSRYLESSSNHAFGINDAGINCAGTGMNNNASNCTKSDAFGGGHIGYWVDAQAYQSPTPTIDTGNHQVTGESNEDIISGIDAQQLIRLLPTGVIRSYFSLSNTTGSAIEVHVLYGGNLGSWPDTTIESSSNSNATVENSDLWYITSDNGNDDPVITHVVKGAGATITNRSLAKDGEDYNGAIYSVTIPAGETRALLNFAQLSQTVVAANTNTADFETLSSLDKAGLLEGLNQDEQDAVANYKQSSGGSSGGCSYNPNAQPNSSSGTLFLLLAGAAMYSRRILKRRQSI